MPFESDRQRRYIYAQAGKGVAWAKRFVAHAHGKTKRKRKRRLK